MSREDNIKILQASWVLPISSPPIANGVVILEQDKIKAVVGPEQFAEQYPQLSRASATNDHDATILLPGLINLHTHLDYSNLYLFDTDSEFFIWINKLIKSAWQWNEDDFRNSALSGARQIALSGTTCVADSSYTGNAAWALAQTGLRGVVGLELFGIDEDEAENAWQNWLTKYKNFLANACAKLQKDIAEKRILITCAPHTPYTVCPSLWQKALAWTQANGATLLAHIAESQEECQWIAKGNHKVDAFLASVLPKGQAEKVEKQSWRHQGLTPVAHLYKHGLLSENTLAAHMVHATDADLSLVAQQKTKVAHCPRSNSRLRNGIAPLNKMLDCRISLGLGTDSLASSDDLNILNEARFAWNLHRAINPSFSPSAEDEIYFLTLGAAQTLNLADKIGSLEAGKLADIALFKLCHPEEGEARRRTSHFTEEPYDQLLFGQNQLQDLYVAGEKIVCNGLLQSRSDQPLAADSVQNLVCG
jgi:5-methylthioadenosine/S-adenosylhomocysteine deaminase